MSIKQRDNTFDVMKGIAIYAVVMGHVMYFGIGGLQDTAIMRIIAYTHMPLFFFISGYFSYKRIENVDFVTPKLLTRFKQLMVPMAIVSTLYLLYMPHSGMDVAASASGSSTLTDLWTDQSKYGYWFPLCLFEIILLYTLIIPLLRKASKSSIAQILIVGATWVALIGAYSKLPKAISDILEIQFLAYYFPVFMIGVYARRHNTWFLNALNNNWCTTLSLVVGAIILTNLVYHDASPLLSVPGAKFLLLPCWHLCLVVTLFSVVRKWVAPATADKRPNRSIYIWAWLGRNSLGIYLLHYFFLFPLAMAQTTFMQMSNQFVPLFITSFIIAALIVAISSLSITLIRTSRPLGAILIGDLNQS